MRGQLRGLRIAGIDGCRAGWLLALEDLGTGLCAARILRRIDELLLLDPVPAVIAIDIPVGLTDAGPRPCDQEARRLLGRPRSSSVFPAPVRPLLAARDYARACEIGLRTDGRKPSRQTWGILPKIMEVDAFLQAHPAYQGRIREVHPEVSFRALDFRRPPAHAKKTAEGRVERERLITSHFGGAFRAALEGLPAGGWGRDDLLDAFAVLWTARRIAAGTAVTIPPVPPADVSGLRMAIMY